MLVTSAVASVGKGGIVLLGKAILKELDANSQGEREIGWREFIHNTKHKVGFVLKKAMPPSLTVSKQKC